jgi:hypothetical protein
VAMVEFVGRQPNRAGEQLLAQTNTKQRFFFSQHFAYVVYGVIHGCGVARTVGKEVAVGVPGFDCFVGRFSGKNAEETLALVETAQDVLFYAVVHHCDAVRRFRITDFIGFGAGNPAGKLEAVHARCIFQDADEFVYIVGFRRNDAVHGAALSDVLHDGTGIHTFDGHKVLLLEVVLNAHVGIGPTVRNVEIPANEAGDFDAVAFNFGVFDAVVANMHVGGNQDLPEIRRVGENFLITGHAGVETNFAGGCAGFAGGFTVEYGTVFEKENGFAHVFVEYATCSAAGFRAAKVGFRRDFLV